MQLRQAQIQNFRCIRDMTLDFDALTVLVGANSTGKSSVLHALQWFFEGGELEVEDICGQQEEACICVTTIFDGLSAADGEALGSFIIDRRLTLSRLWSPEDGDRVVGQGMSFLGFKETREQAKAGERVASYRKLRADQPGLGLPAVTSGVAVEAALQQWEAQHPEQLEQTEVDASQLFGGTGHARLAGCFDFVLVPAVTDPAIETQDGRGTLLRQLLDRAGGESRRMRERLGKLEEQVGEEVSTIIREEGAQTLRELSSEVNEELGRLVPGGSVSLEARTPPLKVPPVGVNLRVSDAAVETEVARQGHGFQRALIIALVQLLARPADEAEHVPGLFLAFEEPELYQHPLQARHFSRTLAQLAESGPGTVQVAYATHSEHFVDPAHYERLRRFRKRTTNGTVPIAEVSRATVDRVAARLNGIVPHEQVELRVRITLRRQLAEAVFARAVLIVEGRSDAGFWQGLADRDGGLDAAGISVVSGMGKPQFLIPWAILTELGVPTYVVFDGDAGVEERVVAQGKSEEKASEALAATKRANRLVLQALGGMQEEAPETGVNSSHAVFRDRLETEYQQWADFMQKLKDLPQGHGDWREKSEDAYREAAAIAPGEPPVLFSEILRAVKSLV